MKLTKDKIFKIVAAFMVGIVIILILSTVSGFNAINDSTKTNENKMVQYETKQEVLDILNIESVTLPDFEYDYYIESDSIFVAESNGIYFKKSKDIIEMEEAYNTYDVVDDNEIDVTYKGKISNPLNLATYSVDGYNYLIYSDVGLEVKTMIEYTKIFR